MASAEIASLSQLYLLGRGVKDTDGDGLADRVGLTIVIPDSPTAVELAFAADIAARANLESLAQDLRPREAGIRDPGHRRPRKPHPDRDERQMAEAGRPRRRPCRFPPLEPGQGFVSRLQLQDSKRHRFWRPARRTPFSKPAGRSFLRWPYFWDIWGREAGPTYDTLERDIVAYLKEEGVSLQRTIIRSVLYEFPESEKTGPEP